MRIIYTKWIVVLIGILLSTASSVAKAQDADLCFMTTSSGKKINLGGLCSGSVTESSSSVRIPIKRYQAKTPIIDVKFNGNYTTEMVVDTGASGILITQTTADNIKINFPGKAKGSLADGSIVEFDTGTIDSIAVGSLKMNSPKVTIAPKASIGLLGHEFLDNYDWKIVDTFIEFRKR
jgi:aspartyl protease family protein